MASVVSSFCDWLAYGVDELGPVLNSWIFQIPLAAFYIFRFLHLFHAIIPDE